MFAALVAGWCISCSLPVAIVNKREGHTEFNANSEILYLDFSVNIACEHCVFRLARCVKAPGSVCTQATCARGPSTPFHVKGKTNKNNL